MKRSSIGIASLTMTIAGVGCGTTPSPIETVPAPNFQVRLTDATGTIEGGRGALFNTGASGDGCILTVLGAVPAGVAATLTQGECSASVGLEDASP